MGSCLVYFLRRHHSTLYNTAKLASSRLLAGPVVILLIVFRPLPAKLNYYKSARRKVALLRIHEAFFVTIYS